ncbi:hypothetical protein EDC32_101629 [Laceyella sacchari]|nr:hypothetical protein EDC32_101629 [Laceyella sacchari]
MTRLKKITLHMVDSSKYDYQRKIGSVGCAGNHPQVNEQPLPPYKADDLDYYRDHDQLVVVFSLI